MSRYPWEASYPPVQYIPRADIDMALFERTTHASHCPYKGDASYFSLEVDGRVSENAAWSYEAPYPAVAEIKEQLSRIDQQQTASVEQRMAKLLSDASKSRSELKAAHDSGSKKKKAEKRAEGETSSPPKSKE